MESWWPLVPSSSNSTSCDSDTLRLTQKVDYLVVKLEEDKVAVTALIDNIKDEIASYRFVWTSDTAAFK